MHKGAQERLEDSFGDRRKTQGEDGKNTDLDPAIEGNRNAAAGPGTCTIRAGTRGATSSAKPHAAAATKPHGAAAAKPHAAAAAPRHRHHRQHHYLQQTYS